MNPFSVVTDFETAVAEYTNAPFAVAVDSCTNALFLCLKYLRAEGKTIHIPQHTFVSIPNAIIAAGCKVEFKSSPAYLKGSYQLRPLPLFDSALRFTANMYKEGLVCLSFSGYRKHLRLGKGGMILTDSYEASRWFKLARNNGRHEGKDHLTDDFVMTGYNFWMPPEVAAQGLRALACLPRRNDDSEFEYQDLSKYEFFKK